MTDPDLNTYSLTEYDAEVDREVLGAMRVVVLVMLLSVFMVGWVAYAGAQLIW